MFICCPPYLLAPMAGEHIGLHMKFSPFWLVNKRSQNVVSDSMKS